MSILRNIVMAIRGGASEVGEAIVDSQALRILEQEIRDARQSITSSKKQLTNLKAKEIQLGKELAIIENDEVKYMLAAKTALNEGKEELAQEIAERISKISTDKKSTSIRHKKIKNEVNVILIAIKKREQQIDDNEIELQKTKTIEEIQKTRSAINTALPSSISKRVHKAMERVKKRHEDFENSEIAAEWLNEAEVNSDLDKKISAAGIGDKEKTADDILAQLKQEALTN